MPIDLSGFWEATYGISSEEEFDSLVESSMPVASVFGLGITKADAAHQAWILPLSVFGSYAAGILTLHGLRGGEAIDPNAYSNGLSPYEQGRQETMTGTLIIPNAYQVTVHGSAGGHQVDNVFGLLGSAGGQEVAACTAFQVAWETTSGPLARLCFRYSVLDYECVDLSSAGGGISVISSGATGGTTAVDFATRGASALIKWNGNSRDRSTRGRTYYGPLSEDQVDSDGASLTSTAQSNITTAFSAFRNSLQLGGFPLAVLSRKYTKATLVAAQTVETTIGTQRRRVRS